MVNFVYVYRHMHTHPYNSLNVVSKSCSVCFPPLPPNISLSWGQLLCSSQLRGGCKQTLDESDWVTASPLPLNFAHHYPALSLTRDPWLVPGKDLNNGWVLRMAIVPLSQGAWGRLPWAQANLIASRQSPESPEWGATEPTVVFFPPSSSLRRIFV